MNNPETFIDGISIPLTSYHTEMLKDFVQKYSAILVKNGFCKILYNSYMNEGEHNTLVLHPQDIRDGDFSAPRFDYKVEFNDLRLLRNMWHSGLPKRTKGVHIIFTKGTKQCTVAYYDVIKCNLMLMGPSGLNLNSIEYQPFLEKLFSELPKIRLFNRADFSGTSLDAEEEEKTFELQIGGKVFSMHLDKIESFKLYKERLQEQLQGKFEKYLSAMSENQVIALKNMHAEYKRRLAAVSTISLFDLTKITKERGVISGIEDTIYVSYPAHFIIQYVYYWNCRYVIPTELQQEISGWWTFKYDRKALWKTNRLCLATAPRGGSSYLNTYHTNASSCIGDLKNKTFMKLIPTGDDIYTLNITMETVNWDSPLSADPSNINLNKLSRWLRTCRKNRDDYGFWGVDKEHRIIPIEGVEQKKGKLTADDEDSLYVWNKGKDEDVVTEETQEITDEPHVAPNGDNTDILPEHTHIEVRNEQQ